MSFGSGVPPLASPPPILPEERGEERRERPSAWVPPSGHLAPGTIPGRIEVVLFVLSSVGYLLIVALLDIISTASQVGLGTDAGTIQMVRVILTDFGWLGMLAVAFFLWFLPWLTGISVRPRILVQTHLVLENTALLAYLVTALSLGASAGVAEALLVLASLSYVAVGISLLLTLVLVLQDWRSGML